MLNGPPEVIVRTRVQCPETLPPHLPAAQPAFLGGWATPLFTGLVCFFCFLCASPGVSSFRRRALDTVLPALPVAELTGTLGGCRRSGSKSKVYAKRTPCVNCANESTVSRNTTRAPSGGTTRALSENSVAIILLWCSPGGHYFSLVPECRSFVLAPRAFFW